MADLHQSPSELSEEKIYCFIGDGERLFHISFSYIFFR